MNQYPLLKYKLLEYASGLEVEIDANTGDWNRDRKKYLEPKRGIWELHQSGQHDKDCLTYDDTDKTRYFERYEYHAIGDENPVLIYFNYVGTFKYYNSPVNKYCLSDDYRIMNKIPFWDSGFFDNIQPILLEYERHRDGEWRTRILILMDDE